MSLNDNSDGEKEEDGEILELELSDDDEDDGGDGTGALGADNDADDREAVLARRHGDGSSWVGPLPVPAEGADASGGGGSAIAKSEDVEEGTASHPPSIKAEQNAATTRNLRRVPQRRPCTEDDLDDATLYPDAPPPPPDEGGGEAPADGRDTGDESGGVPSGGAGARGGGEGDGDGTSDRGSPPRSETAPPSPPDEGVGEATADDRDVFDESRGAPSAPSGGASTRGAGAGAGGDSEGGSPPRKDSWEGSVAGFPLAEVFAARRDERSGRGGARSSSPPSGNDDGSAEETSRRDRRDGRKLVGRGRGDRGDARPRREEADVVAAASGARAPSSSSRTQHRPRDRGEASGAAVFGDGKGSRDKNQTKTHRIMYDIAKRKSRCLSRLFKRFNGDEVNDRYASDFFTKDDCDRLPLHIACQSQNTTLFSHDIVEKIVNAYEDGVATKSVGSLPLHTACHPVLPPAGDDGDDAKEVPLAVTPGSDAEKIIKKLAETYPRGVLETNVERSTALHSLLEHRPGFALVRHVVECGEDALEELSSARRSLPKHPVERKDGQNQIPLHVALERYADARVVQFLLEKYPAGRKIKGPSGHLPLHTCAMWGCVSRSVLVALLRDNAGAKTITETTQKNGDTPLHVLFSPDLDDPSSARAFSEKWSDRSDAEEEEAARRRRRGEEGGADDSDEEEESAAAPVIAGGAPDLLSTQDVFEMIVRRYYTHLLGPPAHSYIPNQGKKKKRKKGTGGGRGGPMTHKKAMERVKALLSSKRGAAGQTVVESARCCKMLAHPPKFPDAFMERIEELARGEGELEIEEGEDEDEPSAAAERNGGASAGRREPSATSGDHRESVANVAGSASAKPSARVASSDSDTTPADARGNASMRASGGAGEKTPRRRVTSRGGGILAACGASSETPAARRRPLEGAPEPAASSRSRWEGTDAESKLNDRVRNRSGAGIPCGGRDRTVARRDNHRGHGGGGIERTGRGVTDPGSDRGRHLNLNDRGGGRSSSRDKYPRGDNDVDDRTNPGGNISRGKSFQESASKAQGRKRRADDRSPPPSPTSDKRARRGRDDGAENDVNSGEDFDSSDDEHDLPQRRPLRT